MAVDARAAVRRALKGYFEAELGSVYPSMKFFDEWPHGQALGNLALSVTIPPAPPEVVEFPPMAVRFDYQEGDDTGQLLYSRGRASLGVQIDVWCGFPAARDEVAPVVQGLLNRPPSETIGTARTGVALSSPGLVVRLPEFFDTICSINLAPLPQLEESSDTQQEGRWRAIWQGTAEVHLLSEAAVAAMQHLTLKLSTNGGASEDVDLFEET